MATWAYTWRDTSDFLWTGTDDFIWLDRTLSTTQAIATILPDRHSGRALSDGYAVAELGDRIKAGIDD